MNKLKYPGVLWSNDLRRKLTKVDISLIKVLRNLGYTYKFIAKNFKVTTETIKYHTNEEFRKKRIDKAKKYNTLKYYSNKDYYRKINRITSNRLYQDPRIKEFRKEYAKSRRNK